MVFPGEIWRAPRSWIERAYHNLIYFREAEKLLHGMLTTDTDVRNADILGLIRM